MQDAFTFLVVAVFALLCGWIGTARMEDRSLGRLFLAGLAMRVVGSFARFEVNERAYGGMGDAKSYFEFGRLAADSIRNLDFSFLVDGTDPQGRWYGTVFIQNVTGFVVFVIGDSIRAAFLVFSLFSYVGLLLCVRAFAVGFGRRPETYAAWVLLLPSLWFWPSSIGKESLMMLALGLILSGYIGDGRRPRWVSLAAGVALAAAIRPHVGGIFALTIAFAELLGRGASSRTGKWVNVAVAAVIGVLTVQVGLSQLGLADADLDGIEEQFTFRAGQTEQGGSKIERATGFAAIPFAFVNVLFRPFPWEATGISALSAVEVWLFWALVLRRRRRVRGVFSGWRQSRFLALGIPFFLALTLLYGVAFANLGIIARQRVVLLPLLLAVLALTSSETAPAVAGLRLPRVSAPRGIEGRS